MSFPNIHAEIKSINFSFTGFKTFVFTFDDIYICKCSSIKKVNYTVSLYESNLDDDILSFELLLLNKEYERTDYNIIEKLFEEHNYPDYIEIEMFNGDVIVYDQFLKDYIYKIERTPYLDLCISVYKKGYENDYNLPKNFDHDECVEKLKYKSIFLTHLLYEEKNLNEPDDCEEF